MNISVTFTALDLVGLAYAIVALMFAAAGIVDEMSFVNPSYGEVLLVAALWPWWVFQVIYKKVTGRYLVNDVKELRG